MDEKEIKTLKDELMELYVQALREKKCTSKTEFATFIGVTQQTISSAFTGKRISENLLNKARYAMNKNENAVVTISMENNGNASGNVQKNFDKLEEGIRNEDVRAIVHEMSLSLKDERESHERIIKEERESHERIVMAFLEKIAQK